MRRATGLIGALLVGLATICAPSALAHPGDLDPSFSKDGIVKLGFDDRAVIESVAVGPRNRAVLALRVGSRKHAELVLARLTARGRPDRSFSRDGRVETGISLDDDRFAVALRSDGGILAGGSSEGHFVVISRRANGGRDRSFSADGSAVTEVGSPVVARDMAVGPGGRIVLAGSTESVGLPSEMALIALTPNGDPDTTFSSDGQTTIDFIGFAESAARAVAISPDGSIVVAGSAGSNGGLDGLAVARLTPIGEPDPTFSGNGRIVIAGALPADALVLSADGAPIVSGRSHLLRLTPSGELDLSYPARADQAPDSGEALAIDSSGRVLILGNIGGCFRECFDFDLILSRLDLDGSPDQSFGFRGLRYQDIVRHQDYGRDLFVQRNGRIVAAGSTGRKGLVVRYVATRGGRDRDGDGHGDDPDRCPDRYGKPSNGCPRYGRRLSIARRIRADLFRGRLRSRQPACIGGRGLEVRMRLPGFDRILKRVRTDSAGRWGMDAPLSRGVYYAQIDAELRPAIGRCGAARSDEIRIR